VSERYPTSLVAVLGGGQLGRMLGLAGVPLGLGFRFLDPTTAAPAQSVGTLIVGALDDEQSLLKTVEHTEVVTYEWEGVPAPGVRLLEARGHTVHPSTQALAISQDRLDEKTLFGQLGIPVPDFADVQRLEDLHAAVEAIGLPAVLKTRRGGYDGKGQAVLHDPSDVDRGFAALRGGAPLILEAMVPFDRELSVIAVRGLNGDVRCWPLVENRHEDGILRVSRAPAPELTADLQATAERYARALLEHFGYVGVLALELFQVGGSLLANEMAPRVHNSGHWSIEGAVTSQFENHLRAILGWPLGATDAIGVSAMVNAIGDLPDPAAILAVEGAHLHRYGKAPRPGRKVGHVTINAATPTDLDAVLGTLHRAQRG